MQIIIQNISDLSLAASKLLAAFPDKRLFALYGEMGAGKTTFVKAIGDILQVKETVNSPTFALVNVYHKLDNSPIYHFDFYRIKNLQEVFDIGYEDYFFSGNYCFLEWPELVDSLLPDNTVKVYISEDIDKGCRIIEF